MIGRWGTAVQEGNASIAREGRETKQLDDDNEVRRVFPPSSFPPLHSFQKNPNSPPNRSQHPSISPQSHQLPNKFPSQPNAAAPPLKTAALHRNAFDLRRRQQGHPLSLSPPPLRVVNCLRSYQGRGTSAGSSVRPSFPSLPFPSLPFSPLSVLVVLSSCEES
ncbi:hypothetical protein BDY24DRAFT_248438 [Mrakia frigida]|uniref:uncharacterized protein n=1 Tax=Mrakia frigida TaxID=29902 RepID=UPI003FCC1864